MKSLKAMLKDTGSLSRTEMMAIVGGVDDGGGSASCSKSCKVKASDGSTSNVGCYANTAGQTPTCLCLDRTNNSQCN